MPYRPRRDRARSLRQTGNVPEVLLWQQLKAGRFYGISFRRQRPVGPYRADFYAQDFGVVVEVDGAAHRESDQYDERRDRYMTDHGMIVLRVSAVDVRRQMESVPTRIALALEERGWRRPAEGDSSAGH